MKIVGFLLVFWPFIYALLAWFDARQWKSVFSVVRPMPEKHKFLQSAWLIAITLVTFGCACLFFWNGLHPIEDIVPRSWGSHDETGEWNSLGGDVRYWSSGGLALLFMIASEKLNAAVLASRPTPPK